MIKYKCSVEVNMQFPNEDTPGSRIAKNAIDELIDSYIQAAVFEEMCRDGDSVIVTREYLEYVDDDVETVSEETKAEAEAEDTTEDSVSE